MNKSNQTKINSVVTSDGGDRSKIVQLAMLLLLALIGLPSAVFADTSWTGANSTDWTDSGNWNNGLPGPTNGAIYINNIAVNTPSLSTSVSAGWDILIGQAGNTGTLNQNAGTLATGTGNWAFIGVDGGSVGTYNLTGSASFSASRINLGCWGGTSSSGTINIDTTGTVDAYGDTGGWWENNSWHVGVDFGHTGTINLTNGTVHAYGNMWLGAFSGTGTFNQYGGTNTVGGNLALGRYCNDNSDTTVGTYNMSGGRLNAGSIFIAWSGDGNDVMNGTMTVSGSGVANSEGDLIIGPGGNSSSTASLTIDAGGVVNVASTTERWLYVGQYDAINATVNVNGGSLNLNANTDLRFSVGGNTGAGVVNLNSGAITGGSGSVLAFNQGNSASVNNTFNLNGGALTIGQIITGGSGGTRDFNFNGGTLKASASSTSFFAAGVASSAIVQPGGAIIDTAGYNITIAQDLADGGGSLTKNGNGTLALDGANTYSGGTVVNTGDIGGSGSLASLVTVNSGAGINLTNGAAGTLTLQNGLTLTTGNSLVFEVGASADQIAITGGTYTAPTTVATVNIVNLLDLTAGTYPLITGASGISLSSFTLAGAPPAGFGYALQVTGNDLELVVTVVAPVEAFWKGGVNGLWNAADSGSLFNWATDVTGASSTVTKPSTPTAVTFSATGAANQSTTLGESFTVKSVSFNASAGNVTIGASGSESLTINGSVINDSANAQAFNVPVTFNGNQTIQLNGAGNVAFNGPVTFTGNQTNIASGATLALNGAVTNTTKLTVDGAGNTIIAGPITGAGGLTKVGNGTLTLSGTYAATGFFQVNAGKAVLAGSTTPANDLSIGEGTGTSGTVDITTGGSVSMPSTWFFVGHNNGDGTLNVSGNGSINALRLWVGGAAYGDNGTGVANIDTTGSIAGTDGIMLGEAWNGGSASGTVNLTNGTVTSGNELWVGCDANAGSASTATFNQFGGAVSSAAWFVVGRGGSGGTTIGTYNLYGGTVTAATSTFGSFGTIGSFTGGNGTLNVSGGSFMVAESRRLYVGEGGTGILNVSGTGTVTCSNIPDGGIRLGANSGAVGTVNLDGGTLQAALISQGAGSGTFNFNGGALKAVASNTTFMQGLAAANVLVGGAKIDTAGNNITIAQALLDGDSFGGGLTKLGAGTLNLNGLNTYTGTTTVSNGTLGGLGTIAGPVVVKSGAALAPGDNGIGTLTLGSTPTLQGSVVMELDRNAGTPLNDLIEAGSAPLVYGGTLVLTNTGAALQAGDSFKLFNTSGGYSGSFALVSQTPGQNVTWTTSGLASSGTIVVATAGPAMATNPTNITYSVSGNTLTLKWPADHMGWILQAQTNTLSAGLRTNWFDVAGSSSTNQAVITVSPSNPTVFYRLRLP